MRDEAKPRRQRLLDNTLRAAQTYKIPHERLSATDIRRRFPQFRVADHEEGYFEPSAGYLHVEACIETQLELAKDRYGAELHTDTPIERYRAVSDGIEVITTSGETYQADQLLVSAGAWLPKLVKLDPPYNDLFRVTRQVMHWFDVPAPRQRFAPPAFPVFIWEPAGKAQPISGFPLTSLDASSGVKIATEGKDVVDPDSVDRTESQARIDATFQEYFGHCFPDLLPRCLNTRVCLYTEVEGGRFVIDRVPGNDRVLFASACSGHGFKHSPALGEALAQTLVAGRSEIDLSPFSLARLIARRACG
jgi:sarcosine oxidase